MVDLNNNGRKKSDGVCSFGYCDANGKKENEPIADNATVSSVQYEQESYSRSRKMTAEEFAGNWKDEKAGEEWGELSVGNEIVD